MRLVVTGGGTGGHVYPALAVLEALENRGEEKAPDHGSRNEILYIGTQGGLEEQITREYHISFAGIHAGALRGKSPLETVRNAIKMVLGVRQSLNLLTEFNPAALLATGGYVCAPVAVAARVRRIPILVYLPDVKPGWAVRFLSFFASRIAVTSEASLGYLPRNKTTVTGYPVRGTIGRIDKEKAKSRLSLDGRLKTLLVLGGSRGAHSINMAIGNSLDHLTEICQVVHASGPQDAPALRELGASIERKERYHLYEYLDKEQLPLALASADLVVSRSGASTMGEFPAAGLPSILIPYPYAGAHQELNADVLVNEGAAIKMMNSELRLLPQEIENLIVNDRRLSEMSKNARDMFRDGAAITLANELRKLAGSTSNSKRSPQAGAQG